ncbi:hypothetical protein SEUCBS139899_004950 [Sporothrix eucalyptigena]
MGSQLPTSKTLLEVLEDHINVDADSLDPAFIKSLPIRCHDQTSNQRIVHEAIVDPVNAAIVEQTVRELKGQPWDEVYVLALARIAATVLPVISGTVLSQTSPTRANDKEFVLFDARRRHKAYLSAGIPSDRIAIKIATTSAGVQAARILRDEGIRTLGTTLFSVPQALAAAQAGMFAISIYFNEPGAQGDASIWPDVADPATEHPMAARHLLIRHAYNQLTAKTGQSTPQLKTASYASPREVMTAPALGADHVTIGRSLLEDLAISDKMPEYRKGVWKVPVAQQIKDQGDNFKWEAWTPPRKGELAERIAVAVANAAKSDPIQLPEIGSTDYLADGVLDKINAADALTNNKLEEGLGKFAVWETASKEYIEGLQAKLNA